MDDFIGDEPFYNYETGQIEMVPMFGEVEQPREEDNAE